MSKIRKKAPVRPVQPVRPVTPPYDPMTPEINQRLGGGGQASGSGSR